MGGPSRGTWFVGRANSYLSMRSMFVLLGYIKADPAASSVALFLCVSLTGTEGSSRYEIPDGGCQVSMLLWVGSSASRLGDGTDAAVRAKWEVLKGG